MICKQLPNECIDLLVDLGAGIHVVALRLGALKHLRDLNLVETYSFELTEAGRSVYEKIAEAATVSVRQPVPDETIMALRNAADALKLLKSVRVQVWDDGPGLVRDTAAAMSDVKPENLLRLATLLERVNIAEGGL
jgi:hypothetical protein